MSNRQTVAVAFKWQAINIVGRQLLSLLVFTTLARLLEPAAFGLLGLVGVYLAFVSLFADQGIGAALVQRQDLEPEHLDTAFWLICALASMLCLGTVALAGPIATFFQEPALVPLLRWSSLGLIISATTSVQTNLFMREMDFRRATTRTLVANLVGGVIGVAMACAGCGVWSLMGQQLGGSLAGSIFLWRASSYRPSFRFSFKHLRDLSQVSLSVFGSTVLWFFCSRLDQVAIGRFLGIPALGLYVVASKIPDLARFVANQPVAEVSLPALSRLQHDHRRMQEAIYSGMELNALVAFAIFGGLAVVSWDLVPLLFGQKWASASSACALLLIYALVNALLVFVHPALVASGGVGRYVLLNVWLSVGVICSCVAGIFWGVNFLVCGLIVNVLIVAIPALLFLRHRMGLSPLRYCRTCVAPGFAALLMVGVVLGVQTVLPGNIAPLFRLSAKIGAGALTYVGCILLFAPAIAQRLANTARQAFARGTLANVPQAAA